MESEVGVFSAILVGLAIGALASLLAYLLSKLFRRKKDGKGNGEQQQNPKQPRSKLEQTYQATDQNGEPVPERRSQAQIQRSCEEKVKEILASDDEQAKQLMLAYAGLAHLNLKDVSSSAEIVRQLAQLLPEAFLETLRVSATQKEIKIDVQRSTKKVNVSYPTRHVEIEPMNDYGQITDVIPEHQIIDDDDEFYRRYAQQDMLVLTFSEFIEKRKILYILLDVSGSMSFPMAQGIPRNVFARGVTLNLLRKAIKGEAKYFLRPFDGGQHPMLRATTKDEAETLSDFVLMYAFSGGGTNIVGAIQCAVNDIKTQGGEVSESEILIISDGEDQNVRGNMDFIRQLLGDKIRLHSCLIAVESEELKSLSTTYVVVGK